MANHLWIYPTKRQDEFYDANKFVSALKKEFTHFHFDLESYSKNFEISVLDKDKETDYFYMYLWSDLPFTTSPEDRMELIDNLDKKDEDLADKVLSDLEDKGELICIEVRRTQYHREITLIERWMRQYFQAITLDEGIYPEILFPIPEDEDYKPKPEKSFIKKFGDWLIG